METGKESPDLSNTYGVRVIEKIISYGASAQYLTKTVEEVAAIKKVFTLSFWTSINHNFEGLTLFISTRKLWLSSTFKRKDSVPNQISPRQRGWDLPQLLPAQPTVIASILKFLFLYVWKKRKWRGLWILGLLGWACLILCLLSLLLDLLISVQKIMNYSSEDVWCLIKLC